MMPSKCPIRLANVSAGTGNAAGGGGCAGKARFVPVSRLEAELGGGRWMEPLPVTRKMAYNISF